MNRIIGQKGLTGVQAMAMSMAMAHTGQPTFATHPDMDKILQNCISPTQTTRADGLNRLSKSTVESKYVPGIVSRITSGVKISCDKEEFNLASLYRCMKMIKALVVNKNISIERHLSALMSAVGKIMVCDRIYGDCEEGTHWDLRLLGGRVLAIILKTKSVTLDLASDIANCFMAHLDQSRPLVTIYGSVAGLKAMGPEIVENCLLPHVHFIIARIDAVNKTVAEIVDAETIRILLVETIQPILPRMKDSPELGTLWSYFQTQPCATSQLNSSGDTSLRQLASPPPKRSKITGGQNETDYNSGMGAAVGAGFGEGGKGRGQLESQQRQPQTSILMPESDANHNNGPGGPAQLSVQVNPTIGITKNQANPAMSPLANSAQTAERADTATTNQETPGVSSTLHVYKLKEWITEEMIYVNFSRYGKVVGIYTEKKKFYKHVKFSTRQEAERCLTQLKVKKYGIFKEAKIDWATTNKFRQDHTEYFKFCEEYGLCYNYNVHDDGCSLASSCKRKHFCLFCFELFDKEENHPSRFNCPNEKEGYLKFGPRNQ